MTTTHKFRPQPVVGQTDNPGHRQSPALIGRPFVSRSGSGQQKNYMEHSDHGSQQNENCSLIGPHTENCSLIGPHTEKYALIGHQDMRQATGQQFLWFL